MIILISGDIGFDDILSKPIILPNSISVSVSGNHIVSSSYYGDTFLEHVDSDGIPPVKIIPESSDTIGFFGRSVDLVAIATNNILRIIHLYKMEILATIEIRPGTLYCHLHENLVSLELFTHNDKTSLLMTN